ncbi:unnamed protein product, partial [Symbiodinium sp. CCMP2456]
MAPDPFGSGSLNVMELNFVFFLSHLTSVHLWGELSMNQQILLKMLEMEDKFVKKALEGATMSELGEISNMVSGKEEFFKVNIELLYMACRNLRTRWRDAVLVTKVKKALSGALDEVLKMSKGVLTSKADKLNVFEFTEEEE